MSPEDAKKDIYKFVQNKMNETMLELRKKGILCEWGGKVTFDFSDEDIQRYIEYKKNENAKKIGLFQRFLDNF